MKRGFTLIEILISISIIAVLTALGIVSYVSINKNARDAKRRGDIEQIRTALEFYRTDNGYYPSTGNGDFTDASNLSVILATYIPSIPPDPKNVSYQYKATGLSGSNYYGYCLAAATEGITSNSCSIADPLPTPTIYKYGTKNP